MVVKGRCAKSMLNEKVMAQEMGMAKEAIVKELGMTKEVEHLLERIKREVELTKQESAKMRTTNDPFKDLLEFIESPMDISVDAKSEPKIIDVSDEDNAECSDKITKSSSQTKKMQKSIIPAAAKLSDKKEPVTNSSKEKELDLFESRAKEGVSKVEEDAWAEVLGSFEYFETFSI